MWCIIPNYLIIFTFVRTIKTLTFLLLTFCLQIHISASAFDNEPPPSRATASRYVKLDDFLNLISIPQKDKPWVAACLSDYEKNPLAPMHVQSVILLTRDFDCSIRKVTIALLFANIPKQHLREFALFIHSMAKGFGTDDSSKSYRTEFIYQFVTCGIGLINQKEMETVPIEIFKHAK